MLLKVTLTGRGAPRGQDLLIDADPTATVGSVALAIAERNPASKEGGSSPVAKGSVGGAKGSLGGAVTAPVPSLSIRIEGPGTPRGLDPAASLADCGLRSGDHISVADAGGRFLDAADVRSAAATLVVREGPNVGQRFPLRRGANQAGRDRTNEVVLTDAMASKRHARFNVTDVVEVVDLGSVNGTIVDGLPTERAILRPGDTVLLGDTVLAVESISPTDSAGEGGAHEPHNRSPYLDPIYAGQKFQAPAPPQRPGRQRLPLIAMLAPMMMGVGMFAMTKNPASMMFVAFSPIMMVGSWWEAKRSAKKDLAEGRQAFASALGLFDTRLAQAAAEEGARRRQEQPSSDQVLSAAVGRAPMLWARRPDRHGFLDLRLGTADLPTRNEVELPDGKTAIPELMDDLMEVVERHHLIPEVPAIAPLITAGVVGVSGKTEDALGTARSLVAQVAALHSPAEVVIGGLFSMPAAPAWDWLKWLPHVTSDHSPLEVDLLAAGPAAATQLVGAVRTLIADRLGADEGSASSNTAPSFGRLPAVVLVVDDGVPVDRPVLVDLAERGPSAGVFLIWVAPTVSALPAAAKAFVAHDVATSHAMAGYIDGGLAIQPVTSEPVSAETALAFARSLAPVIDSGAGSDEASELPARVSFLDQLGLELATSSASVVERWRLSDSLATPGVERRRRSKPAPLNAYIGAAVHGPLQLDLRGHGPHALVGGTTGAGKSEFLQSWIMGLATTHSPSRVTFLFVDYKGGAAFSECVKLPHCVGLVTDLTPHLVQRALRSLNAELRHREHILNRKKEKDVLELERKHDPDCPPSLVIVVDEFAALVSEVPEFVDGVVNVAQRGRSLGLHLILATQRPAGVIKDNLRANTNLRIALRMADESDSLDVVDSKIAGTFDPAIPGRGVAKLGPGRLNHFQAAYVGGWSIGEPPPPRLELASYATAGRLEWAPPEVEESDATSELGPNDLARMVSTIQRASDDADLDPPRKPWLAELASTYDIGQPRQHDSDIRLLSRLDSQLIFGVLDDPDNQRQIPVAFEPDRDGNMAVVGTGGSGKSAFLRTLAVAGALSTKGGPCHVYGLDFASRGLEMLSVLPNVGSIINADDEERVIRLMRTLRAMVDERLARYAKIKADSIVAYRQMAAMPEEPRVLLLVDGYPTFRNDFDTAQRRQTLDRFQSIATDGRQVGVHVVISADRVAAIPPAMSSLIQKTLALRLAGENEYTSARVPEGVFPPDAPPGRGWFNDSEVQVGVLGGSPNAADQASALARLAALARERGVVAAPEVGSLPDEVSLATLPPLLDGWPALGISDQSLAPFSVPLVDRLGIIGPPRSGKSTAIITILRGLERAGRNIPRVYVGDGGSELEASCQWTTQLRAESTATEVDEVLAQIRDLTRGRGSRIQADKPTVVVVFEDVPRIHGWLTSAQLVDLVDGVVAAGGLALGEGESSAMTSGFGLQQAFKVTRTGFLLQPDKFDGEAFFKTPIPVSGQPAVIPGRGYYLVAGRALRVQFAAPSATRSAEEGSSPHLPPSDAVVE